MMKLQIFAILVVVMVMFGASVRSQDLTDIVNGIFNITNETTTRKPKLNRGFDVIVTPEPFVEPTVSPQTITRDNGVKCICVPYYLCDPDTNTTFTDGSFDGLGRIDIRFGENECQHHLDVCCVEGKTISEPVTTTPKPNKPTGCGVRNPNGIDFSIKENTVNAAEFGEFPWVLALIGPKSKYFCGASLIHPQVAITGLHCLEKYRMNDVKVRAGEWDTRTDKERLPFQERNVNQIIDHPEYFGKNLFNDFALLVLDKPFELDEHIGTICLPSQDFQSTSKDCISNGWGKDVFGKAGKYSAILKKISLPIVANSLCQDKFRSTRLGLKFNLHPSFVCAGGQKGVDTCQGDGGSPLSCQIEGLENRHYLAGMVAWGIGCNEERPAAYANIAKVRNWIDQHMKNLGFGTSSYQI